MEANNAFYRALFAQTAKIDALANAVNNSNTTGAQIPTYLSELTAETKQATVATGQMAARLADLATETKNGNVVLARMADRLDKLSFPASVSLNIDPSIKNLLVDVHTLLGTIYKLLETTQEPKKT